MGIIASRPYIIDEFESDDDKEGCEIALDHAPDSESLTIVSPGDPTDALSSSTQELLHAEDDRKQPFECSSSLTTLQGLDELLKLIECHDFEGAQKVASYLRKNQAFSNNCVATSASVAKLAESSSATSSWPSKTQDDVTYKLISQLENQSAGDFDIDHRKLLAKLDEELHQFEADEEKLANEVQVFQSAIPRLKSATRSGTGNGISTDVNKKHQVERKRSPSPHGNRSGIPRYSWAHVTPSVVSATSVESKIDEQTLDACSLSNTLESLPEISDRVQTNSSKSSSNIDQSESYLENEYIGTNDAAGDVSKLDINMSDLSGRVKMIKKHTCLPSLWVKPDLAQKLQKTKDLNRLVLSSSVSTEIAADEVAACRKIGEFGDPSGRKVLDLKRWFCICRPQYKTSCGISAVVSCWNLLFSTMGHGSLKPITQEAAMKLLGFVSPFDNINFGPLTGNLTVMRWFNELNSHFKVSGKCFIMYKPSGKNQTLNMTEPMALVALKKGLKDPNTAFIYHCHNHYFCPIGYEETSQFCVDAYKSDTGGNVDSWIIIGDSSRKYPSLLCKNWEQICLDLNCKGPSYFNIRQSWKGVKQRKKIKPVGENLHCIMAFQKISDNVPASPTSVSSSTSTSSGLSAARLSRLPHRPRSFVTSHSPVARLTADTTRPELGNELPENVEEEEILSRLYAPIMRFYQGYRNPKLRNRRASCSSFRMLPSPKEEDEFHIPDSGESQKEDSKCREMHEKKVKKREKYIMCDDDSEF